MSNELETHNLPGQAVALGLDPRSIWNRCTWLGALVLLSGCAHHYGSGTSSSDPYGFLAGIWHGLVFPYAVLTNILSWALSLVGIDFLSSIQIIGRPNTGFFFYYVGLLIGLSAYSGASNVRRSSEGIL